MFLVTVKTNFYGDSMPISQNIYLKDVVERVASETLKQPVLIPSSSGSNDLSRPLASCTDTQVTPFGVRKASVVMSYNVKPSVSVLADLNR